MRKLMVSISLALVASALGFAAPTSAPNFSSAQASIDSSEDLLVSFKEANLPPSSQVIYTLQDVATVTYGCVSNSTKHTVVSADSTISSESSTMTMSVDSRGKVVGAISNAYPDAPSTFSCSPGTSMQALRVGYSNILFEDVTNNVTASLSGNCATTCSDALRLGR